MRTDRPAAGRNGRRVLRALSGALATAAVLLLALPPVLLGPVPAWADSDAEPVTWSVVPADDSGPDSRSVIAHELAPGEQVRDRIAALGVPAGLAERFWRVASQNITRLDDLAEWWQIFSQGAEPQIDPEDGAFIAQAMALLPPPPYTDATWSEWTAQVKAATGRKGKGLFMPLRKALTGQAHGPDMSDVMPLLQVVRARHAAD